jgi:site-specific recombinase XerD
MNRKSSNPTEKDPLFVEEHNIVLSRNYFIIKLKALLSYLCFVHSDYSGHSLRRGAATTCASNGIQDHMIQTL